MNLLTKTPVRILIVAALVVLVYGGAHMMQQGMKPPSVGLPPWDVQDLPMHINGWEGGEAEMPPEIRQKLGAHSSINRSYRHAEREPIAVHVALFDQYDVGALHNPANCYRSSGWRLKGDAPLRLAASDGTPVSVALSTWERDGQRVTVAYWYQLGDHIITDRVQLGKARWDLRGSQEWPALVKVLMQTSTDKVERSEEGVQELAEFIFRWLNDPDFRKTRAIVAPEENKAGDQGESKEGKNAENKAENKEESKEDGRETGPQGKA